MKKEEFLENLEKKLDILIEEERKIVIADYNDKIKKRIKKKEKEENIIASFGDVELLAKNILKEKGIKLDKVVSKRDDAFFSGFVNLIENISTYIAKKSFKDILIMLGELLFIILIVALMKLPFILFVDLLTSFFSIIENNVGNNINKTIDLIVEVLYILVAVLMFISLFKKRFEKYRIDEKKQD